MRKSMIIPIELSRWWKSMITLLWTFFFLWWTIKRQYTVSSLPATISSLCWKSISLAWCDFYWISTVFEGRVTDASKGLFVLKCCIYPVFPNIQAQSQGGITFKVVPGLKEEPPCQEPKVQLVLSLQLCWLVFHHTSIKSLL